MSHTYMNVYPSSKQLDMQYTLHDTSLNHEKSRLQKERNTWTPTLPYISKNVMSAVIDEHANKINLTSPEARETIRRMFPETFGLNCLEFIKSSNHAFPMNPLKIGVVLSGGQAPGGHNVIAGIYDYITLLNTKSQLYGFIGGPQGIYTHKYIELTNEIIDKYRNEGGFHMIKSGRHKIETEEQKLSSSKICQMLELNGLVIIGGDDSNTNAAILAEYFLKNHITTSVVGVPKTIDGDLRNAYIEASFGFDTAVKVYSEFIGNLCTDLSTSGKYYHFVRLMGRSASHITLECALQTHPNYAIISEEIQQKKMTLMDIANEVVEMIVKRHENNKDYGIILIPEGLVEFLPEMGNLINELNSILANGTFEKDLLSTSALKLYELLPKPLQEQLLLDRDPHGNVHVSMIATERLLIYLVTNELKKLNLVDIFHPQAHFFGYEGRSGLPSNFDANYAYSLGNSAAAIIECGYTGYMAVIKGLHRPPEKWSIGGIPFTKMLEIEKRKDKYVPVIKKFLVELDSIQFKEFAKARHIWKFNDCYRSPGPIQFEGPLCDISNYTIIPPTHEELVPTYLNSDTYKDKASRYHFYKPEILMSPLEKSRLECDVQISPLLTNPNSTVVLTQKLEFKDSETQRSVLSEFPMQCRLSGGMLGEVHVIEKNIPSHKGIKIGVALTGQQSPGVSNILWGLFRRIKMQKGTLIGIKAGGLICEKKNDFVITEDDLSHTWNQGGFTLLGRHSDTESLIATKAGLDSILRLCNEHLLDGFVIIGGRWALTDATLLTEHFLHNNVKTKVIAIPATQNNNLDHTFVEATLGFDTASKCYSQLVGNILTDAASATKYWYFVRIMGRDKSHVVLEAALQSHPNITLISESYSAADKTLEDVVMDIANVICARADKGKNFGTVLIPEGLLSELPQMRHLLQELNKLWSLPEFSDKLLIEKELIKLNDSTNKLTSKMSPWSLALLKSLPQFIRKQLIQPRTLGRFQFSQIATEELLSKLVAEELALRKKMGNYNQTFTTVCLYLGYQARSSLPSQFDCSLGLSLGHLAAIGIESGITGYGVSMRGLCGKAKSWRPSLFPLTSMLRLQKNEMYAAQTPMVPSNMVKLDGKALKKFKQMSTLWEKEEKFCNPGAIQFFGSAMFYYSLYLFEQNFDYLKMLSEAVDHCHFLNHICTFGIPEKELEIIVAALQMLKKVVSVSNEDSNVNGFSYNGQDIHKDF